MAQTKKQTREEQQMPSSVDAERAVLGACLLNHEAYLLAAPLLRPDDFYSDAHRRIYRAMLDLDMESQPIDIVSLSELLKRKKEIEVVGGVAYISSITDGIPQRMNVEHHCKIVVDKAKLRRLIYLSQGVTASAFEQAQDADTIIASATGKMLDVMASSRRVEVHEMKDFVPQMFAEMHRVVKQKKEGVLGLTFGIDKLDAMTGGMLPSENIVIGGYSSDGKSLFCKQIVYANLLKDVKALVFTQEMTKEQYVRRMIPEATGGFFPGKSLRDMRELPAELEAELDIAETKLMKLPLFCVDSSAVTTHEMSAIARAYVRREKIKLVIMDFIQLIRENGEENDYQRVTRAAESLRQLSKDEGINTIIVSQLTWKERGKKMPPNLGMLRASGDIAQGAHIILFPYRPENAAGYLTEKDQIRIGKMREGGRSPIPVELNRTTLRYEWRDPKDGSSERDE